MTGNIVIKTPAKEISVNNGFTANNGHLAFKDISVELEKNVTVSKPFYSQTPLFYSYIDHHFYASTDWRDLVTAIRDRGISLNLNYVYNYIQFQCPLTSETLCDKIYYLRGGETLDIDKNGDLSTSFVPPAPPGSEPAEPAEYLKERLIDILSGLDIAKSVFHISAGLDSSLLAILASRVHAAPLTLVTCKTRGRGASDEIHHVERFARDFNAHLTIQNFVDIDVFKKGQSLIEALGYPIAHPSHLVEFLLDETCKDKETVVTGRGPDEYLAGYEWHKEDYSRPEKHFDRVCVTKPVFLNELFKDFSPPGNNYSFWESRPTLRLTDRLSYDLRTIAEAWNIIHAGLGRWFNINLISPFLDKRLQRFFYFLDDDLKTRNGIPKWFLRESFKDLYPDYLLNAPKHGFRLDLQPYFSDYGFTGLFDILYTSSGFSQRYINEPFLRRMISETLQLKKNWGWQLWNIYLCSLAYLNIE